MNSKDRRESIDALRKHINILEAALRADTFYGGPLHRIAQLEEKLADSATTIKTLESAVQTQYWAGYHAGERDGGTVIADTTADAVEQFKARIAELETQLETSNQRAVEREHKIAKLQEDIAKPHRWIVVREGKGTGYPNGYASEIVSVKRFSYDPSVGMMIFI
jgi:uncharacterized coiled-coil protein SlyX